MILSPCALERRWLGGTKPVGGQWWKVGMGRIGARMRVGAVLAGWQCKGIM